MKIYNFNQNNGENILIYGAPGTGKTHLACLIGKKKQTLLFDVDLGAKTLGNLPKEITRNIIPIQYTQFSDLNEIYQMLAKNNTAEKWTTFFKKKGIDLKINRPFEAIILDSLSELQRQMELELSKESLLNKLENPQNIKPLRIQDWGAISSLTETVVADAFGSLPLTFICTAHEQMVENENTGETIGTPKLRGKLAFDIGKHFDFMGRLTFAKSGQRILMTRTEKKWQAKSRGKHKPVIVEPDIGDIL